ncbi:ribonuclease Z [Azospirillum oryzae]|uniref:Ribonuclease Z n=1 Tax=Azospirillum oryzae TaxID=286727 RepID=A0A1X7HLX6_9PROT|nr:MBL fold metallo-hydrolase [Azospirillum oryzae]SMF88479.1 ribonuclease Z [Azospirillum oryzae]
MLHTWRSTLAGLLLASFSMTVHAQSSAPSADTNPAISVTLLGTGTPTLNTNRFGFSTLVQAGGLNLVFDAGRGNALRLAQINLPLGKVDATFLTHFHSDHLNGLGDLWTTSFLPTPQNGRKTPFALYGPKGTKQVADGLQMTFADDVKIRQEDHESTEESTRIDVHEFSQDGVVFEHGGVRITAFTVDHGEAIKPAVGYKVEYNGHSVVMSGDTRYSPAVIKEAKGADLLIHEVSIIATKHVNDAWAKPSVAHYTSPEEAGKVFAQANPKLAVFSHISRPGPQDETNTDAALKQRAQGQWPEGRIVVGTDLMRIDIGDTPTVVPWASTDK